MTFYGYFYNSCTYESAAGLVSLHQTKAGAWRAMRQRLWETAVRGREDHLHYGGSPDMYRTLIWERHLIQPIEVQP